MSMVNLASSIVLAIAGTKKSAKLVPGRILGILSDRLPYMDLDTPDKGGSEEILAQARKEAEVLAQNPDLSPLDFLSGKGKDRK